MKLITKIQTVSDIITNSSSEVFVTNYDPTNILSMDSYGCLTVIPITREWLQDNWDFENDVIRTIPGLREYLSIPDDEWNRLKDSLLDKVVELAEGYYFIDLEDHYNWETYKADADKLKDGCFYHDYRH